ncbi:hypothetical protein RND81_09G009500 [Saponaria officinalis]|uniref:Reverse transcriptase zinc-binding domain-containing protein n=1 Tax=Saponaria officinalis TaxID=3572 RepID=A0AAW1IGE1_SAPOF
MNKDIGDNHQCKACVDKNIVESQEHIFRDCPIVVRSWRGSILGIRSEMGSDCSLKNWVINWLTLFADKEDSGWGTLSFLVTIWTLRCSRNDLVFSSNLPCSFKIINLYNSSFSLAWNASRGKKNIHGFNDLNEPPNLVESLRNYFSFTLVGDGRCPLPRIKVDAT